VRGRPGTCRRFVLQLWRSSGSTPRRPAARPPSWRWAARVLLRECEGPVEFDRAAFGARARAGPRGAAGGVRVVAGAADHHARRVTINTTSRARTDLVLDVVESLGFEFSLVSASVVNVGESVLSAASESAKPASVPSLDDPEVAAMLAEYIAKYERDWLDMDIPALGGLTPREAAVDPVARNDLIALLNSFPRGHPNTMDADRLRDRAFTVVHRGKAAMATRIGRAG